MRDSLRDRTSLDNNRSPIRRKISTTNVAPESSKSLKEQPFEIGKPDCVSDIGFSFDAETDLFCNRSACLFDLVQIAKSRETDREEMYRCTLFVYASQLRFHSARHCRAILET